MNFCSKCGSQVDKDTIFCSSCGEKLLKTTEKNNTNTINQTDFLFKLKKIITTATLYIKKLPLVEKNPLLFNGIIMFIFSFPLHLYFEEHRLPGLVLALLNKEETNIWNKALSANDLLIFLGVVSIISILGEIIFIVLKNTDRYKRSETINNYCIWIPLVLTVVIVIYSYPRIINYLITMSYIIY